MPGKVNPVIPEMMIQVCAWVMGNNLTTTITGQYVPHQLNMLMPLMGFVSHESLGVLSDSIKTFDERFVQSLRVNEKRALFWVEQSLALATPLIKVLGYDKVSQVVHKAWIEGKILREKEIEELLEPQKII